jgi:hypothetical protein
MTANPIFEQDPHVPDESNEYGQTREVSSRSRWPDDGLAPNLPTARPVNPLHPLGLFGSVLGRR